MSLAGCGLENIPLLSQPGFLGYPAGSDTFRFQNGPPGGDAGFLGYDLYYKIYNVGDSIDNSITTIDDLKLKFRRLTQYTTAVLSSPLIPIADADKSISFEIDVDFSGDFVANFDSLPKVSSLPAGFVDIAAFRRGVTYSSSSETKLWKDFSDTDADITPAIWTVLNTPGADVALALYVVSYGVDPDFGALYSLPLFLGNIQFNLPPYP